MSREALYTAAAATVFVMSVGFAWAVPLFALVDLIAGWLP